MSCEHTTGEVINIGNPDEYSIYEFAEIVARLCGVEVNIVYEPLPADDPSRRRPDINKAKKLLGWEPSTTLEQGLSATIDYFINQMKDLS